MLYHISCKQTFLSVVKFFQTNFGKLLFHVMVTISTTVIETLLYYEKHTRLRICGDPGH
jgi:hypothetical protein